jgi:hypothetical protein
MAATAEPTMQQMAANTLRSISMTIPSAPRLEWAKWLKVSTSSAD